MGFETAAQNLLTAAMTITSAVVATVAYQAYRNSGSPRIRLIAVAFAVYFVKGVILSAGLFVTAEWGQTLLPWSVAFDLAIIGLFYAAAVQRSPG